MSTTTTKIPAFLAGHALQSLRDSGYTLPAAVAEVVDNSIEAQANEITIHLEENVDTRGKSNISHIVIADDGTGMGTDGDGNDILQHYLQVGYSSRYMSTTTIGKYGVGAKLAALNFAKRIDVWSRTSGEEPWRHVYFDLQEALDAENGGGDVMIDEPSPEPIDEDFEHLLPEGSGTVVMWSEIDRLEAGRWQVDAHGLRLDLEKELSRMFRDFIDGGIVITVNDRELLAHDPLFLMEGTWADQVLNEEDAKKRKADGKSPNKPGTVEHFAADLIADETFKVRGHEVRLRVTLYPEKVTRARGQGGDNLSKKLRVPDNQGALSFMRLDREISYTNVPRIFPRGVEDPDRFIGIEVRFRPELDDYFGVRNVKRGVEPHGELRDKIRGLLKRYIPQARAKLEERWGKVAKDTRKHTGEHAPITEAANEANRTLPKGPMHDDTDVDRALDDLVNDVLGDGAPKDDKKAYLERIRNQPFVVESVDFPGQTFIDVQHIGNQVIIRLNTRHRFYRELWEPIRIIADQEPGTVSGDEAVKAARRTIEALTLLVIAYGKAESMNSDPYEQYGDLRNFWGQFLDSLMGKVKNVV